MKKNQKNERTIRAVGIFDWLGPCPMFLALLNLEIRQPGKGQDQMSKILESEKNGSYEMKQTKENLSELKTGKTKK